MHFDISTYIKLIEGSNLFEFNVININDIEKQLNELVAKINYEPARQWFFNSVRKYLINDEKSNFRITSISSNAPDWLKKKHAENAELFRYNPISENSNKLNHIIDWLNSLNAYAHKQIDPSARNAEAEQKAVFLAQKYLKSLSSIDIKGLLTPRQDNERHHVDDWFKLINSFADDTEDDSGITDLITYPNHVRWVKVASEQSLSREGKLMGHCVGGYWPQVKKGQVQIYSLRDSANKPHATIEVKDEKINQVKGKENKVPVAKYIPYVKDILNKLSLPPESGMGAHDIKECGFIYDREKNQYGTLYELSEVVYTAVNGLEIILAPDGKYYIWEKSKSRNFGTIEISKRGYSHRKEDLKININDVSDDKNKNEAIKRKLIDTVFEFLNAKDKANEIEPLNNFYGYYTFDNKFVYITDLPVFYDKAKDFDVLKSTDEYVLVNKNDKTDILASLNKYLIVQSSVRHQYFRDKSWKELTSIRTEIINFLNSLPEELRKESEQYSHSDNINQDYLDRINMDLTIVNGKFMPFVDGATKVFEFPNGSFYKLINTYHMYINDELVLSFNHTFKLPFHKLWTWNNSALMRNIKAIAEAFNKAKITLDARGNKDKLDTFKKLGLLYRNNVWSAAQSRGGEDEHGYQITKISTKESNIIDGNGDKVGLLVFDGTNEIIGILDIKSVETIEYLVRFAQANPKIVFTNSVNYDSRKDDYGRNRGNYVRKGPNLALFSLGYMANDGKLLKITDVWPTENIVDSGGFTWVRKSYILKNFPPIENRFALRGEDKKSVLVVDADNTKKIKQIIPIEDGKIKDDDEVNILPYVDDINKLISAKKLGIDGLYVAKLGLEVKNGQLSLVTDNSKVKGFMDGKIVYEDGHAWLRSEYPTQGKTEWKLVDDISKPYSSILTCLINDNGISEIKFPNQKYKANKKMYREYLNDMLDILDDMDQ